MKSIQGNYESIQKSSQIDGKDREINPMSLAKKRKKKSKAKPNPNKIRVSLANLNQKLSINEKIFPKSESTTSLLPAINISEPLKESTKTLKVLSFETKAGVFVRGKIVESDNFKDIKKKFYPLGYGDMIKLNRKKIGNLHINNISDIRAKDPYKWGREQAMLLNEEKILLMKKYTLKINGNSSIKIEDNNSMNMHFKKYGNNDQSLGKGSEENSCVLKGFEPTFKKKKHEKKPKKKIESALNMLSMNDYLEKSANNSSLT